MSIEDVKKDIERRTGVPANLLTGETEEELVAQSKALLAYKKSAAPAQIPAPKRTTREQFAEWIGQQMDMKTYNPFN